MIETSYHDLGHTVVAPGEAYEIRYAVQVPLVIASVDARAVDPKSAEIELDGLVNTSVVVGCRRLPFAPDQRLVAEPGVWIVFKGMNATEKTLLVIAGAHVQTSGAVSQIGWKWNAAASRFDLE